MEVILHIGRQKTGSTAIQSSLASVRPALAKEGILYPAAFGRGKSKYIKDFFSPTGRRLGDRLDTVSTSIEQEFGKGFGGRSWDKVIISNENLFGISTEMMQSLADFVAAQGGTPSIWAYVRRPDEHVVSLFQQRVRTGGQTPPLDAFVQKVSQNGYYETGAQLDRWAEVFGKEAMHVRLFHRDVLLEDPYTDFMHWIGLTQDFGVPPLKKRSANESYDPAGVDVLRYLQRYYNDNRDAFDFGFLYDVRRGLRALNTRDRIALSREQAEMLLEACRADREHIAETYLPPDQAALFLAPTRAGEASAVSSDLLVQRTLDVLQNLGALRVRQTPVGEPAHEDKALLAALDAYRAARPGSSLDALRDSVARSAEAAPEPHARRLARMRPDDTAYRLFGRLLEHLDLRAFRRGLLSSLWLVWKRWRLGADAVRLETGTKPQAGR